MNILNYSDARDEAERLSRNLKRDVEPKPITCDCDYSRDCGRCAGEGLYYELAFSSCGHVVQDGDDLECEENDCVHRGYLASIEREEQLEVINS